MRNNKDAVKKVFDDLDAYRNFCVQFGWVYNEQDLYKPTTPWGSLTTTANWEDSIGGITRPISERATSA